MIGVIHCLVIIPCVTDAQLTIVTLVEHLMIENIKDGKEAAKYPGVYPNRQSPRAKGLVELPTRFG